jgi:hypothetical protein
MVRTLFRLNRQPLITPPKPRRGLHFFTDEFANGIVCGRYPRFKPESAMPRTACLPILPENNRSGEQSNHMRAVGVCLNLAAQTMHMDTQGILVLGCRSSSPDSLQQNVSVYQATAMGQQDK